MQVLSGSSPLTSRPFRLLAGARTLLMLGNSMGRFVRFARLMAISAVLGGALGTGIGPAMAANANSQEKNFTVGGKGYINRTYVNTDVHTASATILRDNAANVPAGYIGVKVRVFWDSGNLCAAGAWNYNPNANWILTKYLDHSCGGWIYAQGRTEAWNGPDYVAQDTYRTVNLYG